MIEKAALELARKDPEFRKALMEKLSDASEPSKCEKSAGSAPIKMDTLEKYLEKEIAIWGPLWKKLGRGSNDARRRAQKRLLAKGIRVKGRHVDTMVHLHLVTAKDLLKRAKSLTGDLQSFLEATRKYNEGNL